MEILELLKISGGKWIRKSGKKKFLQVKVDSREIVKNDAFLVIRGGYNYISDAIEKGATTIIVDKDIELRKKVNIIKVDDCMQLLPLLAHYNRKSHDALVIGITGSVGKTTTKELLYNLLKVKYQVIKNDGNENNLIGLSKTLLKIDDTTDIAIVEMGMNHEGEIHTLSCISNPDVGIITNVGTSHIGNFKNKKEILNAKIEILDGMEYGVLLLNGDDAMLNQLHRGCSNLIYKVGTKNDSVDLYAYDVIFHEDCFSFHVFMENQEYTFHAPTKGMIFNILLALQVGLFVGIEPSTMEKIVNGFEGYKSRLEKIKIGTTEIIDDCYNASYESFMNALTYIKRSEKQKILIVGDILELGKYSKKIHKKLGKQLRKIRKCQLLLVGKEVKAIYKQNPYRSIWFKNIEDLEEYLTHIDFNQKVILIKASHAMHFDKITEFIKKSLND